MAKRTRIILLAVFGIILVTILVLIVVVQLPPNYLSKAAVMTYSSSRGLNQGHVTHCDLLSGNCEESFNNSNILDTIHTRKLSDLIDSKHFTSHGIKLKWIGIRIRGNTMFWEKTRDELTIELPKLFRSVKNILLFPGLLSEYSSYDFGGNAFKGGYLGELTQWSDLIAVLYLLGHNLSFATSHGQLKDFLTHSKFDLLYTDYLGMNGVYDTGLLGLVKCKIRLLDSFGTEPVFAFKTDKFLADKRGDGFTFWNFEHLKQLLTLYPHTPDNSFLGFAFVPPNHTVPHSLRKNQAVVYGKQANFYDGKGFYLTTLSSEVPLHGTVRENFFPQGIPRNITNHGFLSLKDLTKLLQESRVFIGLGFPFEGPGALEALANGCSFIQPKFNTPLNKYNTPFFGGKPTERGYTSQVPYLEHFVGEPYVYTIDITKKEEIISAIRKALKFTNFSSFLPHEFTQKGMMERIGAYVNHQDFCEPPSLRMTEVTASSSEGDQFSPNNAVDDFHTQSTCFKSKRSVDAHWWKGDLGKETIIGRIKITLAYDWVWASRQKICSNPYRISLLDKEGTSIVHRDYKDCRLVYDWRGLTLPRVRFVKIESLMSSNDKGFQLVLCSVDVFPYETARLPEWPHWSLLNTVVGKAGQNCRDVCIENQMICEPDFFSLINTRAAAIDHLGCVIVHSLEEQYASYTPAISIKDDPNTDNVPVGHCIISDITNLMGCSGQSTKYSRLCPCRHYVKGQITVPDLHPY